MALPASGRAPETGKPYLACAPQDPGQSCDCPLNETGKPYLACPPQDPGQSRDCPLNETGKPYLACAPQDPGHSRDCPLYEMGKATWLCLSGKASCFPPPIQGKASGASPTFWRSN